MAGEKTDKPQQTAPIEKPGKFIAEYHLNSVDETDRLGVHHYQFNRSYGSVEIRCQGFEFHPGPNRGVHLEQGKKYRITIEEVP